MVSKVTDFRTFSEWMVLHGWSVEHRRTGHMMWRHPAIRTAITTAKTPSDARAWKNNHQLARRLMRHAGVAV